MNLYVQLFKLPQEHVDKSHVHYTHYMLIHASCNYWQINISKQDDLSLISPGSILGPRLFFLYINDLPDDTISNISIYTHETTILSKCEQTSYLQQHLQLFSELESDLRDTVDWGRKWLADFNARKNSICFV